MREHLASALAKSARDRPWGGPAHGLAYSLVPELMTVTFYEPLPERQTRYRIRPAGPACETLWIAVCESIGSVYCFLGNHLAPADRIVDRVPDGGGVCDLCAWDLTTHRLERAG